MTKRVTPAKTAGPKAVSAIADPAAFFAALRRSLGPLTTAQVAGFNGLLIAAKGLPLTHAAYALATAWHEAKAVPTRENLNYSVDALIAKFSRVRISLADARRLGRKAGEAGLSTDRQRQIANLIYGGAWGRENLGNTEPGDGWDLRGRGVDQCTGRRNYLAVDRDLELGGRLIAEPDLLLDVELAARALVTGMLTGRYTRHKLSDFAARDYVGMRRIINGQDAAEKIAGEARAIEAALTAGGWK